LPGQIGQEVVTIEMNLIVALDRITTGQELFLDVRFPRGGQKSGQPIHVMHDLVGPRAGLDVTWPAHHGGHPPAAFPVGVLLAAERCHRCIGPCIHVRAVVGGVEDDSVVGNAQLIQ